MEPNCNSDHKKKLKALFQLNIQMNNDICHQGAKAPNNILANELC